jgi:hypothetical protein
VQRITDASVKRLAALKQLEGLNLFDTGITQDGVRELRGSLPDRGIVRRGRSHVAH